jgi:nitrite reductase (NADH) large subunit
LNSAGQFLLRRSPQCEDIRRMHGILFGELKKFIDNQLGGDSWKGIQQAAGLAGKFYTPVADYPDEEFLALLTAAAEAAGYDRQSLLLFLGQFSVPELLALYRRQIKRQRSVMHLLAHLEEMIHAVVRLRNPGITPPKLWVEQLSENKIVIHYISERKLCSFGLGLLQGLAMEYGEPLHIHHQRECLLHGGSECVIAVTQGDESIPAQPLQIHRPAAVPADIAQTDAAPVVIVGAGLVGIQAARELLRKKPGLPVRIYGDEPWDPYNRVRLSELLAGDAEWADIAAVLELTSDDRLALLMNCRVRTIDPEKKLITAADGRTQAYSHLILATGSHARPADTQGRKLSGICVCRNIDDAHTLLVRTAHSQGVAVLGGGIMGIEVAFALKQRNPDVKVVLIHRQAHLMNRELDAEAGGFLLKQVEKAGIQVCLNCSVAECAGETELEQIRLSDGQWLDCDTLVSCTGVIPNIQLAQEAGLAVGRGIRVNQHMQTSDPWIYAVGDCIEYNGKTYGTLAPGIEQAAVAADNILGIQRVYRDAVVSMQAKIKHLPVFSLSSSYPPGHDAPVVTISYRNEQAVCFRQLNICRGRLVGARAVGEWGEAAIVQQAIDNKARIWPWRRWYFRRYGLFSPDSIASNLALLHHSAVICACGTVTCGELTSAAAKGSKTAEDLSAQTGAGLGCGTCKPVLAHFAGAPVVTVQPNTSSGAYFFLLSLLAALLPVFFLLPGIPVPQSVLEFNTLPTVLHHPFFKQVSGYAVLSLMVFSLLLSVNNRLKLLIFFQHNTWRFIHVAMAAAAGAALLFHANFSVEKGFFRQILLVFTAVLLTGLSLSTAIAMERSFFGFAARSVRPHLLTAHLMAGLLFLAYIVSHIVAAYYF